MSGEKGSDTSRLFHGVKEFRENDFEVHREIFKNLEKRNSSRCPNVLRFLNNYYLVNIKDDACFRGENATGWA